MRGRDGALTIVTGASSNHYHCLGYLLRSLDRYEAAPVIVYDLGLTAEQSGALRAAGRQVVAFPFERYPPHVDGKRLLTYAWKPAMVHEVMRAHGLPLLYLDAGDMVHETLDRVRAEIARVGFYSPYSGGTIGRWCHPTTIRELGIEPELLDDRNRDAAIVGFGDTAMARAMIVAWFEAAMKPEIICPEGSSKQNHRYDQAILSVLAARATRRHGFTLTDGLLGISTHNDPLTDRQARIYMKYPPTRRGAGPVMRARARRRQRPLNRLARALKRMIKAIAAR